MEYTIISTIKSSDKSTVMVCVYDKHPAILKRLRQGSADIFLRLQEEPNDHIPCIYAVNTDGEDIEVIEELIEGETLEELLLGGKVDAEYSKEIALQLCDALIFLQHFDPPIIHRDIKPSNIIITSEGLVKLIDFDSARVFDRQKEGGDTVLLGTRDYAAPEQFGYSQTDIRSDIYTLGVVLKEMIEAVGSASGGAGDQTRWDEIVDKCTRFDPENRYANAAELKAELSGSGETEAKTGRPGKSKRLGLGLACGLGVLLLGLGGYLLLSPDRDAGPDLSQALDVIEVSKEAGAVAGVNGETGNAAGENGETGNAAGISEETGKADEVSEEAGDAAGVNDEAGDPAGAGGTAEVAAGMAETGEAAEASDTGISPAALLGPEEDGFYHSFKSDKRIYYTGPYYETEDLAARLSYDYVETQPSSGFDEGYHYSFMEQDYELAESFFEANYDRFGDNYTRNYYPAELGFDYEISNPILYRNNRSLCGLVMENILTGELIRVPDDKWYSYYSCLFIDRDYLADLDKVLYVVNIYFLEDGQLGRYVDRVVLHDDGFIPPSLVHYLYGAAGYVSAEQDYAVWNLTFNYEGYIKSLRDADYRFIDKKLYELSDDGRVIRISSEAIEKYDVDGRAEFIIETSDYNGHVFTVYIY